MSGNTVLITGGATGIGLELGRSLLRGGNEVIICGRRRERLEQARKADPEFHIRVSDVSDAGSREDLRHWIEKEFPRMNVLVNNAGVQHVVDLRREEDLRKADEEIAINLSAPIHLTAAFLPLLLGQPEAAVVNISSGLAFTPLAHMPMYCATKAALHSLTMSLRHQLRDTSVRVFEIIPPIVTSELGSGHRPAEINRAAMPTDAAVAAMVDALERDILEFPIGDAATAREKREAMFPLMNRR